MAAQPNNKSAPDADGRRWMTVGIPIAAVALIVVLMIVMGSVGSGGAKKMSDGSNGTADDSELKELSPGVKARDVKEGTGDPCPPGAKVTIHYTGWLTDGTVFDSSKDKGAPATFELGGLIRGWQEGIPGMKPGGIRKLVIAPDKGYGKQQKGKIPADSTLIFEVELIAVVPGPKPPPVTLSDGTPPGGEDAGLKDIGGGLKIRDLKVGTGTEIQPGGKVKVHYTGWLTNGTVFDSSVARGEPITFGLDGVVKGWQEGIPGMKVGGVRKLVIPPEKAYGSQSKEKIPANSTLVFEVELLEVQ